MSRDGHGTSGADLGVRGTLAAPWREASGMEQVALRLRKLDGWTLLGGEPEAKKPVEVVVRSFERPVLCATGAGPNAPDSPPVEVPPGEGRRLTGRFFFARPASPDAPCLISFRGL